MSCSKPLIRFYNPYDRNESGRVYSLSTFFKERLKTDEEPNYEKLMFRRDVMLIPCGQCIQCKIRKREDWVTRMELEARTHDKDSIYFITLTYDDDHVPNVNLETGEIRRGKAIQWKGGAERPQEVQTLWMEDIELFMKRLRKASKTPLRYFLAGEYGEKTSRPHYHMILYGWMPTDLKPIHKINRTSHYTSDWLVNIWKMGNVDIAPAAPQTYRYVAGYVLKKLYGDDKVKYQEMGMKQPFCVMSRRPGLGDEYYKEHKEEIWRDGYIMCSGGKKQQIPEYYWRKLEAEDPQRAWDIKRDRQTKAIEGLKYSTSTYQHDYKTELERKESALNRKMKRRKGKL